MKKFVITIVILIMGITILWLLNLNRDLNKQLDESTHKTDTVWIDKPFIPKKDYSHYLPPKTVYFYFRDTIEVEKIEYRDNVITVIQKDSTTLEYSDQFLTHYPNNPKLLQLLVEKDNLTLTTFKPNGESVTEEYSINLDRYIYNYQPNNLTYKKTSLLKRFTISPQYTFRPMSNMHDLDLGLKYNTSKFNYEIGLNVNYYPTFKNSIGFDPYVRVYYNF